MSEKPPRSSEYDAEGTSDRIRENRARLGRIESAELLDEAAHLAEIQRHREWQVENLGRHAENLESDLSTAAERIRQLEAHSLDLENARDVAVTDAQNLRQRVAEREAHLANIDSERDEALADALHLRQMLEDRNVHLANVESDRDEALADACNLRLDLEDRDSHSANVEHELDEAIVDVRNLRQRLVEKDVHAENLERERDEARRDIRNLRELVAERDAHLIHVEHTRDEALAEARNRRRILAEREAHFANLEFERDEANEDARNVRRVLADREARLEDLESHLRNVERRLPRRPTRLAEGRMFPKSPDPATDALFREGERLLDSREDIRERFGDDAAAGFWYWLLWHGRREEERIAALLPPVPDPHLISRIVGEQQNAESYFRAGLVDWWSIDGSLRRTGFDPTGGGRVLDFGCGCGRILSSFALYADRCELHGADVDAESIRWCQANLPVAQFAAIDDAPPTPYDDGFFDAVYSFSVFSHLPEQRHLDWLAELARITRSGASLVVTIQGEAVARKLMHESTVDPFPSASELARRMPDLDESGFLFFPYRRLAFQDPRVSAHFEDWDLEAYGSTFILEDYVRSRWTEWFDVVEIVFSPDDWQDHVLLRRR